jgi:tetratricopeptide (TPR) repeat protein
MRSTKVFDLWVRRATQQLDNIFPDNDHKNRVLWKDYLPHALYLMDSEEFHHIHHEYVELSSRVGRSLQSDRRYNEAKVLLADCLQFRERDLESEHPDTLTSVSHLDLVLEGQGKYEEAEAMHRRALEGREKALGLKHPDTLISVSHLASVLEGQGKYKEAEAMHRRAHERENAPGLEHPGILASKERITLSHAQENSLRSVLQINFSSDSPPILPPSRPNMT